jgi:hypothetical protein
MPHSIHISASKRMQLGNEMIRNYHSYIKKRPNKTPSELVDVIYLGYRSWFDNLGQKDLDYFNELFEKASLGMDIDVHWEVTVKRQLQASNVFNSFLKGMKPHLPDGKKDTKLVTQTLNEEFGREFKIGTKSINIIKAFSSNPQLKMVARRMVEELAKLGYKF